jgi:two-component system, chemotaxis family, protein-glutamate methylesterase/glutaminase
MTQLSTRPHPIRVLIADDSAFMRTAIRRMVESDPAIQVVATAQDGRDALEKVQELQPDVVTLDVEMPRLNGLDTLRSIMKSAPRPVIMISSLTQEGAETTLDALDAGAFDCIPKQLSYASLDIVKIKQDLLSKIHAAAHSRLPTRLVPEPAPSPRTALPQPRPAGKLRVPPAIIALGTSTGGPKALQQILPLIPKELPVGILIVQHMPLGFTGPFARRLDNLCQITVREATPNDPVEPGVVYIAPAGMHMTVWRRSPSRFALRIGLEPLHTLHTPSVDVMMLSVAEVYRSLAMGIILTGMGADGALGMKAIKAAGGYTVGQDEASCAVYGMPRSCAEAGVLGKVVPLMQVPDEIAQALGCPRL